MKEKRSAQTISASVGQFFIHFVRNTFWYFMNISGASIIKMIYNTQALYQQNEYVKHLKWKSIRLLVYILKETFWIINSVYAFLFLWICYELCYYTNFLYIFLGPHMITRCWGEFWKRSLILFFNNKLIKLLTVFAWIEGM